MIVDFRVTVPAAERRSEGSQGSADYLANYGNVYTGARGGGQDATAMIQAMDSAGVERGVLQAEWAYGDYRKLNAAVADIVSRYPDQLIGFCTVDPGSNDNMADVVREQVKQHGMRGVNLQPFSYAIRANDTRFYKLYETCQELDVPVTIHSSINFSTNRSIDFGRPLYLCDVACEFPDLKIVANHGGWPWVPEMVAVAWKHPNVYIELGAVAPRYIGTPGSGWEVLLQFGNSILQDRVLFATDCMVPFERAVSEMQALPLKPHVKEKWMGSNALSLLHWT